jgi:hypothetical protein
VEDHGGPPADRDAVVAAVLAGQLHGDPDVLARHARKIGAVRIFSA